jgi:mitochondrial fission protein ELM1
MFSNQNPKIVQIRRELRGKLPDSWLEEVIAILEYQLTYQSLDELPTEDLLKLRIGTGFSATLNQLLMRLQQPEIQVVDVAIEKPQIFRLPWQQ